MSPSVTAPKKNDSLENGDFDLQGWLKEITDAENLMDEVEAKTDMLQAKMQSLLKELAEPVDLETPATVQKDDSMTEEEKKV